MLAQLSHQWKLISFLQLSWSRDVERSPIWVTATAHLYVPPKDAGHPKDPQEVSQWSITVQKHELSKEHSQIQSKGQTWLEGTWYLCQTCGWRPCSSPGLSWTWCPALTWGRAAELSWGERSGGRAPLQRRYGNIMGSLFQWWVLAGVSCLFPSPRPCTE